MGHRVITITATTTLEDLYTRYASQLRQAIGPHLPRLRALATGLQQVTEFGVRDGRSTTALLLGAAHVTSYDVKTTDTARHLQEIAGDRWTYRLQDSRQAPVEPTELLFIDSLHTFAQVDAELTRHAHSVSRYLAFHDTVMFGSAGEVRGTMGIRPAIDNLMMRDPTWHIVSHDPQSAGLLVLERRP